MNPCNHTSVGILVWRAEKLLLIERARPPYGWAPPAGHVDSAETYLQAARRELGEEVDLYATHLADVHARRYMNRCRRPGGEWHDWVVFEATTTGHPVRNPGETRAMKWVDRRGLDDLAALTLTHLADDSGTDVVWAQYPGLEPVWLTILRSLGTVT